MVRAGEAGGGGFEAPTGHGGRGRLGHAEAADCSSGKDLRCQYEGSCSLRSRLTIVTDELGLLKMVLMMTG